MPYKPNDIPETATILGVAFIVGALSQYIKQRVDVAKDNANILWISLAAGLSSMVFIGILFEYTGVSPAFLMAISGIAGWAGIAILTTLAAALDGFVLKSAKDKFNIDTTPTPEVRKEVVNEGSNKDNTGTQ